MFNLSAEPALMLETVLERFRRAVIDDLSPPRLVREIAPAKMARRFRALEEEICADPALPCNPRYP